MLFTLSMNSLKIRSLALAALTAVAIPLTSACTVGVAHPAAYAEYEPQYYDGYVVYYDEGRPYYHVNGARVWISDSHPYYHHYVNHYRTYGPAYHRWYSTHGERYRTYRHR